jgi:general secretion pathway protein K
MMRKERGVAVVLAMGVVAVAAIAATAIMATQSSWTRRQELAANHVQAQAFVQGGVDWIRTVLGEDLRTSNVDHLAEPWALKLAPISVENGTVSVSVEDQQSFFNINNLVKDGQVNLVEFANFHRLLELLGLPAELASALIDWIDNDELPQPDGAEDDYYLTLVPPYVAANRPLVHVSELALVRGFDDEVRARLRPFVTALPRPTALNVNTAPAEVLSAVIGIDMDVARGLVAKRDPVYFRNLTDFAQALPDRTTTAGANLAVNSSFFVAALRATIGQSEARGTALLDRGMDRLPAIVWRKLL